MTTILTLLCSLLPDMPTRSSSLITGRKFLQQDGNVKLRDAIRPKICGSILLMVQYYVGENFSMDLGEIIMLFSTMRRQVRNHHLTTIHMYRNYYDGFVLLEYPLAVKLGTITPDGRADVFSYAEDEMVEDPLLAHHLAHFGINISQLEKVARARNPHKCVLSLQLSSNIAYILIRRTNQWPKWRLT